MREGGSPFGVKPWSLGVGILGLEGIFKSPAKQFPLHEPESCVVSMVGFSKAQREGTSQSLFITAVSC